MASSGHAGSYEQCGVQELGELGAEWDTGIGYFSLIISDKL